MTTPDPHDDPRDLYPLMMLTGLTGLACIVAGAFIAWMNGSIA